MLWQYFSTARESPFDSTAKRTKKRTVRAQEKFQFDRKFASDIVIVLTILIVSFGIVVSNHNASVSFRTQNTLTPNYQRSPAPTQIVSNPNAPEISAKPLDRPNNGQILADFLPYYYANNYSELCIKTAAGSDYVVKLVSTFNKQVFGLVYIRGGNDATIRVAYGTYILKYASGKEWYGTGKGNLFGKNTYFAKADDTFEFTEEYGWTVQLYPTMNGNLGTEPISEDEF